VNPGDVVYRMEFRLQLLALRIAIVEKFADALVTAAAA
jgi:hypothetical protein